MRESAWGSNQPSLLIDTAHEFLNGPREQKQNKAGATGRKHYLHVLCGHGIYVLGIELTGNQSSDNIAQRGTQKPDAHHLADISLRRQLGRGRQPDG